jgi:hypothetical protein
MRATSSAIRTWKYLGGAKLGSGFPNKAKAAAFVMSCYDPKTGGFADAPGGKPDVATTAVGVMAAVEFEAPKAEFAKALEYLQANAKSFEEVRIGAAAVEAWGVKDCPFDLKPWLAIATNYEKYRSPSAGDAEPVPPLRSQPCGSGSASRWSKGPMCFSTLRQGPATRRRLGQGGRREGLGRRDHLPGDASVHAPQGEAERSSEGPRIPRPVPQRRRRVRNQAGMRRRLSAGSTTSRSSPSG